MPAAADLLKRCTTDYPEDDVSQAGGAIDTAGILDDLVLAAADQVEVVSSESDIRDVWIRGRLASGTVAEETLDLNGTTPSAASANTYERILEVRLYADGTTTRTTSGTATVTVRRDGDAGDVVVLGPNISLARRAIYGDNVSSSSSGTENYYTKEHWLNSHGSETLTAADMTLTADPETVVLIGCEAAGAQTQTITNRRTAPGSVTFVDDGVAQPVPGTDVAAGANVGVWIHVGLPQDNPAIDNTYTTRLRGSSV